MHSFQVMSEKFPIWEFLFCKSLTKKKAHLFVVVVVVQPQFYPRDHSIVGVISHVHELGKFFKNFLKYWIAPKIELLLLNSSLGIIALT